MQKYKDFIYYNRKEIITVILCLFCLLSFYLFKNKKEDIVLKEENNESIIEKEKIENKIVIDIKGEIKNPGTYELKLDDRIIDAIEKSGGLTEKADVSNINLSEKIKDEMLIYIPSIEEKVSKNNVEINNKNEEVKDNNTTNDNKISINSAGIKELMSLNGIGENKAKAIIDYREKNGLFKDIKDITKVSGIGNNIFEKIKDYIKI